MGLYLGSETKVLKCKEQGAKYIIQVVGRSM